MEREIRVISETESGVKAVFAVTRFAFMKILEDEPDIYKNFFVSTNNGKHFKSLLSLHLSEYSPSEQNFYNMIFYEYAKLLLKRKVISYTIRFWIKFDFPDKYSYDQCKLFYSRKDRHFSYYDFIKKFLKEG